MNTAAQLIDNYINPLMLRGLRQMVRNRLIIVLLHLYLAVLVFACFSFILAELPNLSQNGSGNQLFSILAVIMSLTCFIAVVGLTATTTANERLSEDLMFISTLRPSSIVFGKAWAGAVLTLMLMSVTAPFVMLAYLLRGLDIQTIILTFFSVFTSMQILNSIVIAGSAQVKTKAQMSGFTLLGIVFFVFCIMPVSGSLAFSGVAFGIPNIWLTLLNMLCIAAGIIAVFLSLAVRAFSPPTSNRSLPVRITILAVFFGSFIFALCHTFGSTAGFAIFASPFVPWCAMWLIFLCILALVVVSEPDTWSVRVRRSIPKGVLRRCLVFPFYTGAANGFVWWFLMVACTVAVFCGIYPAIDDFALCFLVLFSFNYALTAMFLRLRFASKICKPEHTGVIVLILALTLIFGGAMLYAFAVADLNNINFVDESYTDTFFSMFNPLCLVYINFPGHHYFRNFGSPQEFCAAGWAVLLAVPFIVWFIRRCRKFTPNDLSGVMTLDEAVEAVKQAEIGSRRQIVKSE